MKPDRGAVLHTRELLRKLKEVQEENKDLRNKVGKLSKRVLEDKGPDLSVNLSPGTTTSVLWTVASSASFSKRWRPAKVAWSVDEDGEVFTFDMPKGVR